MIRRRACEIVAAEDRDKSDCQIVEKKRSDKEDSDGVRSTCAVLVSTAESSRSSRYQGEKNCYIYTPFIIFSRKSVSYYKKSSAEHKQFHLLIEVWFFPNPRNIDLDFKFKFKREYLIRERSDHLL